LALPPQIGLLQYVDDLLLSGITKKATVSLLNFLGHQGLRVLKTKLQFVEEEVRYLGHLVSKGKCRLSPERIQGITGMLLPLTKRRELRKFLGLIGYCRLWVEFLEPKRYTTNY
jgi:hypothetical protein